ncbi:sensor histidine kinase [Labrys neptuniae]
MTLFGFLYLEVRNFLRDRVDRWVQEEEVSLVRHPVPDISRRLKERAERQADPSRPMALFDRNGVPIAGSAIVLPASSPSSNAPFEFTIGEPGLRSHFRGIVHRFETGERLLIAQDIGELREFDEVLWGAMILAGAVTATLGFAGAVLVGAGAVRKINGITRATQEIITGDLSKRLPTTGTSGDVDRLAKVVNEMLSEIERLMHEVKGVCDNIAHDLRTPLTRLLAGLERLERRAETAEDYRSGIEEAVAETRHILRTFSALLRISEIEDGARRSGFQPVDLVTIAEDAVDFYEPAADEKSITLACSVGDTRPVNIPGEPSLLFEAVGNLLDNAIKFSPTGSKVSLSIDVTPEEIRLAICDMGPGIPLQESDAVFRRFYRMERSRHTPGNGLGLSLVAAVAKLHRMQVTLEQLPAGSRIALRYRMDAGRSGGTDH